MIFSLKHRRLLRRYNQLRCKTGDNMKLAHFALDTPFTWQEDNICTLVLENNKFYRDTITTLTILSTKGRKGSIRSEDRLK